MDVLWRGLRHPGYPLVPARMQPQPRMRGYVADMRRGASHGGSRALWGRREERGGNGSEGLLRHHLDRERRRRWRWWRWRRDPGVLGLGQQPGAVGRLDHHADGDLLQQSHELRLDRARRRVHPASLPGELQCRAAGDVRCLGRQFDRYRRQCVCRGQLDQQHAAAAAGACVHADGQQPDAEVGQTIIIQSSCTNNPLTYTWTGCSSTSSLCTDTVPTTAAAGPKAYTLVATNAAGNSPPATVTVNWQPLPTAPPACTVTSSNASPYTGQSITLTATCSNSPTSYAWQGCTSTTNTCSTTSASAGAVTYSMTATNQIGTSTSASTMVTWQSGGNGVDYCGSYPDVKYIDVAWGSGSRYFTATKAVSRRGASSCSRSRSPRLPHPGLSPATSSPAEYQGPPTLARHDAVRLVLRLPQRRTDRQRRAGRPRPSTSTWATRRHR